MTKLTGSQALPCSLVLLLSLSACGVAPSSTLSLRAGAAGPAKAAGATLRGGATQGALGSDLALSQGAAVQGRAVGVNQSVSLLVGGGQVAGDAPMGGETVAVGALESRQVEGTWVKAAEGGRVASPDGKLYVDVPPGVLVGDTDVALAWVDTSSWNANETHTPGLAFHLDLHGGFLKPGTQLMVKGQVDPRFWADVKAHQPDADPATFGLSMGANGAMQLAMPVHGPALVAPHLDAASFLAPGSRLVETGILPLNAPDPARGQAVAAAGYRLMDMPVSLDGSIPVGHDPNNPFYKTAVPVSNPLDCSNWKDILKFEVPGNWEAMKAHENGQVGNGKTMFDCTLLHSFDWFNRVNTDLVNSNKTCVAVPKAGVTAKVGSLKLTNLPVRVIWDDGEASGAGKPAVGAVVRFDGPWSQAMQMHQANPDVVVPASGQVNYPFLEGVPVKVSAFTVDDPTPTTPVVVTTKAVNDVIVIKLKQRHPLFTLKVDSVTKLPAGKVQVGFTIDGEKGTRDFTWTAQAMAGEFKFPVFVGPGAKHSFQLTSVSVTPDGKASASAAVMGQVQPKLEVFTGKSYAIKALVVAPDAGM